MGSLADITGDAVTIRCEELVYTRGKSDKYWRSFVVINRLFATTHWWIHNGRAGTKGVWHTMLTAKVHPVDRLHEKLGEGYALSRRAESLGDILIQVTVDELEKLQKNMDREMILGERAQNVKGWLSPSRDVDREELRKQLDSLMER